MSKRLTVNLGNEIDLLTGFPFESKKYSNDINDIKLLRGDNIIQGKLRWDDVKRWSLAEISNYQSFELQDDDVVLAMDRPWIDAGLKFASVSKNDLPCLLLQRTCRMRGGKNLDTRYLKYIIGSPWFSKYIQKITTGSLVPHISARQIKDFSCELPSLIEQQNIAAVLSALDSKIELNNHINTELEAMAKTLYDYWFVQFDFPDANGKPYKTSGGKMIYNAALKREIPEGWQVSIIGKVAKTALGGTPSTEVDEYWKNADIPWLSSAETASFPVISSELKVTQKGIEKSAAIILPKGTVIISIVRYIRPSILGIDAATNQSVIGIKECSLLKSSFIYPYFCSEVPRLMGLRTGAQQPHINKGIIDESPIVLPTDSVLNEYYKKVDSIYAKIMTLAFESHELIKLRDYLLPMLMNGQVTVVNKDDI